MPRRSRSSSALVVLGAGRGLSSVLQAMRGEAIPLTVIASLAYSSDGDEQAERDTTGAAAQDLRVSLGALSSEEGALHRAIRRPMTMGAHGRHPLGNLLIASVASGFGDYGRASTWLGEQLAAEGAVLPATVQPVRRQLVSADAEPSTSASDGGARRVSRLRLVGDRIDAPAAAVTAIERARLALLAPGSLYRDVLAAAAVPDLADALARTEAHVIWVANLAPGLDEPHGTDGLDHLRALQTHRVRVDTVLYDPGAALRFDPARLAGYGIEPVAREIRSVADPTAHDPAQLRSAIRALIRSRGKAA